MIYVAYTIHVVVSLFLIMVVLLQQGKGADLSVFGGGTTQSAFGARGAATLLHKLTVVGFIAFIITTVTIGFLQGGGGGSVMSTVTEESASTPEGAPVEVESVATDDQPAAEEPATLTSEEAPVEDSDTAEPSEPPDSQ